jgi:hypothetical protein
MAAMFHGLAFGGGSLVGDASDAFSACDCVPGEVPERSIGAVSKTVVPFAGYRGFESLPLRSRGLILQIFLGATPRQSRPVRSRQGRNTLWLCRFLC